MKKITLALLILTVSTPDSNARTTAPFREICDGLNLAISTGVTQTFCENIATQFPGVPSFATQTCLGAARDFSNDPDTGGPKCHTQFKDMQLLDTTELALFQHIQLQQRNPTPQQSYAAEQCEQKTSNDFICRIDTDLVLPSLSNIMSAPIFNLTVSTTDLELTPEKCNCIEDTFRNSGTSEVEQEKSLNLERKRINGLIFESAGKKLINDFASTLEDFNFFATNNISAIGNSSTNPQVACNKYSDFRETIMDRCRRNGVNASVAEKKMNQLMNAFEDGNSNVSSEASFNRLKNDIMNYQLDPSSVFPGRSGTLTRQAYDRFRLGASVDRHEVRFVNEITDLFLDDETVGPVVLQKIQEGTLPGAAIYEILKDESNEDNKRILNRYLRRNNNSSLHRQLKMVLETRAPNDLQAFLRQTFDIATDLHPGLKVIFKDTELFLSTRERMHSTGSHSLLQTLDNTPGSLVNYFQERCDKLKSDMAEAACVPDDNYISRADRSDLIRLLAPYEGQLNTSIKEVLLCKMPEENPNQSIFTRLAFGERDRLHMADYFLMKVNPAGTPPTRFARFAQGLASGDERTFRTLNALTARGESFSAASAEVASTAMKSPAPTQEKSIAALNDLFQRSQDENFSQVQASGNYQTQGPAQAQATEDGLNTESNQRNLLRDFLADKINEEEVERHLSNTSPEEHSELIRLREELRQSSSRIQELLQESERNKLDNLRADYERLEREVNEGSSSGRSNISENDNFNSSTEVRTASVSSPPPGPVRLPDSAGVASGGTTSTFSGGSTVSSGEGEVNRTIASEESVIATTLPQSAEIVIESTSIQTSSPEGTAQISNEVIAYLQNSSPDLNTLKQLKESGIIIKYKVLEEGTEVQREMRVSYSDLSPEAREVLDRRLQMEENLVALDRARRAYSYSALKHLLGIRVQSQSQQE